MKEHQIQVVIDAKNNAEAAIKSTEGSLKGLQGAVEKHQASLTKMAAVGTAAFVGVAAIVKKTTGDYMEAERSQRQLEHAVMEVSKGTREQVKAIEEQSAALQKRVGIDGDALKLGTAQLSTFGLQSESVVKLTKSLADLTVNQAGVNAGSGEYVNQANNIAKALNGQFGALQKMGIRFTEAQQNIILYGTEAEKVAAIQEGLNQNLRETTDTLAGTTESQMAILQQTMGELSESIGAALIPALNEALVAITPIVQKVVDWISEHPKLTAAIIGAVGVLGGLAAILGVIGLALPAIVTGFQAIMVVLGLILSPIGLVVLAVGSILYAWKELMEYLMGTELTWGEFFTAIGDAVAATMQSVIDWFKKAWDWIEKVLDGAKKVAGTLGKKLGLGSSKKVDDAVISPSGNVISTHPQDWLIATKNPGALVGGGSGITLNFAGATFMGKEGIARQIGDEIVRQLGRSNRL